MATYITRQGKQSSTACYSNLRADSWDKTQASEQGSPTEYHVEDRPSAFVQAKGLAHTSPEPKPPPSTKPSSCISAPPGAVGASVWTPFWTGPRSNLSSSVISFR